MSVLLTVRGTLVPKTLDAARVLHNETAGSAPGIAAARALGDLSHNVFAPAKGPQSSAKSGELLFLDRWVEAKGIMDFFSNAHVQEQAGKMFSAREASVWMPATGSFSYALPAPKAKNERYAGIVRGAVKSAEQAIEIFAKVDAAAQRDARRRGLVSHELFVKLGAPAEAVEIFGLDIWCDFAGMTEHYGDQTHMAALGGAFAGRPDASVWEQAPGEWSEW